MMVEPGLARMEKKLFGVPVAPLPPKLLLNTNLCWQRGWLPLPIWKYGWLIRMVRMPVRLPTWARPTGPPILHPMESTSFSAATMNTKEDSPSTCILLIWKAMD